MDNSDVQLVGGPCGQHGPYTFYKAFKYTKNGVKRIVTLSEFFFVKMWRDSDLLCIGELQLLWSDKNSEQTLASLRLYFLPENTPEGRTDHGEDEVLAISEKVVIRLEDLVTWVTAAAAEWTWGRVAHCEADLRDIQVAPEEKAPARRARGASFGITTPDQGHLDFSDVDAERSRLDDDESNKSNGGPHVVILSFPKYCRYRAMMKRLEGVEDQYLKYKVVNALGGFYVTHPNTRVLFCRDTFDYPELEGHELLCNHLAPKLKGRPRGSRRRKRDASPVGSDSNESESSIGNHYTRFIERSNSIRSDSPIATRRSARCHENNENKQFLKILTAFMKAKHIPMGRIPSMGYKELNLYEFYTRVQKLGGYDAVTTNKLWKSIFDEISGHQNSTSAATVIRRHYERLLLAYERHEKGEEHKPLPVSERRRLKSKRNHSNSVSDAESCSSDTTTPANSEQNSPPPTPVGHKDPSTPGKPSSLRSVRVKPERQKDKQICEKTSVQNNTSDVVKSEVDDIKPKIEKLIIKTESMTIVTNSAIKVESAIVKLENSVAKCEPEVVKRESEDKFETKIEEDNEAVNPLEMLEMTLTCDSNIDISKTLNFENDNSPKPEAESVPEKDAEPLTAAVAPVAPRTSPDKLPSPMEGKENIPLAGIECAPQDSKTELIEIPLKTKPPELDMSHLSSLKDTSTSPEVKKIKLDILKEGGLEVTPVRASATPVNDYRPTVIQPTTQIIAKPLEPEMMPPPSVSINPKRNINSLKIPVTPPKQSKPDAFAFMNGSTPPKVLQSKSIYSYSEKTVYGNPKDILPTCPIKAQTAKFPVPTAKPFGGDPVDLTVSSPQKPVVEITHIPHTLPSSITVTPYNRDSVTKNLYKTNPSLLEGRKLNSNLEITLVGPKNAANSSKPPRNYPSTTIPLSQMMKSQAGKRLASDNYNSTSKTSRLEENGRFKHIPPASTISAELNVPNPFTTNDSMKSEPKPVPQIQKLLPSPAPSTLPPYMNQFPESVNGIPPYMHMMDSLYYQAAIQTFLSNSAIGASVGPVLPIPSPQQLKIYAELLAHGRLANFPFQPPQDGHSPMLNNKKQ